MTKYIREHTVKTDASGVPEAVAKALADPKVAKVEVKFWARGKDGDETWLVVAWAGSKSVWWGA